MFITIIKKIVAYIRRRRSSVFAMANYPDIRKAGSQSGSDEDHLRAAMDWLCLAQDVTKTGGVSAFYDISKKEWSGPYRETTGYIIETFVQYFLLTGDEAYLQRAKQMGEWELSVQCPDGSFGEVKKDGSVGKKVFNTGQIILGFVVLFNQTKDPRYLAAAERAAQWLVKLQDPDGSWSAFTTQGPRTYHARVAWPLLQVAALTGTSAYVIAAQKNIAWILDQQQDNHWFTNTSLSETDEPWTHLIAYTISGLLECYLLLDEKDEKLFAAFYGAANVLLDMYNDLNGAYLPCSFDSEWHSRDAYSCLTGDAQLAIVWMQIYQLTKEEKFRAGAYRMIEQIKKTQITINKHKELCGGIFGSFPVGGDYAPFLLINWAAKFFADALLLKQRIQK